MEAFSFSEVKLRNRKYTKKIKAPTPRQILENLMKPKHLTFVYRVFGALFVLLSNGTVASSLGTVAQTEVTDQVAKWVTEERAKRYAPGAVDVLAMYGYITLHKDAKKARHVRVEDKLRNLYIGLQQHLGGSEVNLLACCEYLKLVLPKPLRKLSKAQIQDLLFETTVQLSDAHRLIEQLRANLIQQPSDPMDVDWSEDVETAPESATEVIDHPSTSALPPSSALAVQMTENPYKTPLKKANTGPSGYLPSPEDSALRPTFPRGRLFGRTHTYTELPSPSPPSRQGSGLLETGANSNEEWSGTDMEPAGSRNQHERELFEEKAENERLRKQLEKAVEDLADSERNLEKTKTDLGVEKEKVTKAERECSVLNERVMVTQAEATTNANAARDSAKLASENSRLQNIVDVLSKQVVDLTITVRGFLSLRTAVEHQMQGAANVLGSIASTGLELPGSFERQSGS